MTHTGMDLCCLRDSPATNRPQHITLMMQQKVAQAALLGNADCFECITIVGNMPEGSIDFSTAAETGQQQRAWQLGPDWLRVSDPVPKVGFVRPILVNNRLISGLS